MSDNTSVRKVVDQINRGYVVFEEADWLPLIKGTLTGMVANSEIVRCEHGEFAFYMAWHQKENDSESDVAHRLADAMASVTNGER